MTDSMIQESGDIAIVGMAAHLPGAPSVEAYWQMLRDGRRAIRRLSDDELREAGEAPHLLARDDYVPFAADLPGFADFDAEFWGFSPKDAAIMDPQHRQFLEVAWEAMEHAGHPPESIPGPVGVYAGCGMGSYFYFNICSNRSLVDETGMFLLRHTGNDKDFLSTRLSHALDLTGPSVNVQTACSTSLVATHFACQSLLLGECDMALAGGVTIELPHARGYMFKEGEILSPDGECHAFDHRAQGTVFGSGAGVVVLRRLADAIADGDHIWAVIKGSAINNDGASKAGYLAPSVDGQAAAIAEAQAVAGVSPETVGYVECHGTGTYLGDPIEVAALTEAFRLRTEAEDFCRIGSVKTNIGHLDTAAGVASLMKASLALHHRQIPPSLGFEAPNPAIPFDGSPFRVNDRLTDWMSDVPRRAGVNSLGVGGTNAHVVLEEAPAAAPSEASDWPFQPILISARGKAALDDAGANLAAHFRANPKIDLADAAFTLKEGRRAFDRRRVTVASTPEEAAALLEEGDPRRVFTHSRVAEDPRVVFMFPGGGAQYVNMGRDLYETEPTFRDHMDAGLAVLATLTGTDPRADWLAAPQDEAAATARLMRPSVQLPLIMIVEYALARLWMDWGVAPAALIGHSMGENAAAAVAGVMSLPDCVGLVHLRGRLMDSVPEGGMLSVGLSEAELRARLGPDLDLAAVNAPGLSVASGPKAALDRLQAALMAEDIDCQRIPIDIAAHSRLLDDVLAEFESYLRGIALSAPRIPILSNRSGDWMTAAEATDPAYWVAHLRGTVMFADGLTTLAADPDRVYLEVGPGKALGSLAGQHDAISPNQIVTTLRHPQDKIADDAFFVTALARLWAVGVEGDWAQIWGGAHRRRIPLPTYPFQRQTYFIEPGKAVEEPAESWPMRRADMADWGWRPVWRPEYAPCEIDLDSDLTDAPRETWLIFADTSGIGDHAATRLRNAGHPVTTVRTGDAFARLSADDYVLAPERGREGFDQLLAALGADGRMPTRIVHLWLATADRKARPGSSFFHRMQEQGFWTLFHLAQAWGEADAGPAHLLAVTSGAARVRDGVLADPGKATLSGPIKVIPREFPQLTTSQLDLAPLSGRADPATADAVLEEMLATPTPGLAALRGTRRYRQDHREVPLERSDDLPIRHGATVLLTGGFGGIGLTVAETLIRERAARIVLVARVDVPPRADWSATLRNAAPQDRIARRIRAVQRLEAAGGEVLTLAADVSNVEDMRAARAAVEARFGAVHAVIHAAGVIDDAPILAKQPMAIEEVFTPKIHGTEVLAEVFPDGDIDALILFSSTSTVTAPAGQVDYVAANDYLNAVAAARVGGKTRVIAIDWGIWSGVGMAAEAMEARIGPAPAPEVPADPPMLDVATFDATGNRLFTARWRAADLWVLNDHRTRAGDAVLPGTGYLELAAEALAGQGEHGPFEIADLTFLAPFRVADSGETGLRLTLARSETGYRMSVESEGPQGARLLHAEADIALLPMARPAPLDAGRIATRLGAPTTAAVGGALTTPQEAHLNFGPRWKTLRETRLGESEGLARLTLPTAAAEDSAYLLHPGLMDIATGWAMELIPGYGGARLWVPVAYGSVRVHGPLPSELLSHVRLTDATEGTATFAVTLAAPDGSVAVEVEGFSIHRLAAGAGFGAAAASATTTCGTDAPRPLSAAEERLRHTLTQGILPEQGGEAFLRAISAGVPQIIVSSLDLAALTATVARDDQGGEPGAAFERPQLDSDFAAPETETQRRLALLWADLLGVAEVGIDDSFFDLGGHSLIAVRLFAQIKKAFAADFPISVLFEAPTIRKIAVLIGEGDATEADPQGGDEGAVKPARRFTHLVPMHQGEGGPKTPFFLVAGMFGNVLNLRHLAHLIGTDRPFYGLQARGLLGDEEPHRTIEAAAASMLAEIRQVRPHGPYMLGGFSGGGITAYEIAQRLKADGEYVTALVMLDTPLPRRRPLTARDRAAIKWSELREAGPAFPLKWAARRIAWEIAKRRPQGAPEETGDTPHFHDAAIEAAFYEAIAAYDVTPWDGPLTLFRPPLVGKWEVAPGRWVSDERAYVLPDNDWSGHAPHLQVHEVPGDHDSMVLEPNVRVLAARMRKIIAAAEGGPRLQRRAAGWDHAEAAQ